MYIRFNLDIWEIILLSAAFILFLIQIFYYMVFYFKPYRFIRSVEKGRVVYDDLQQPVSVIVYAKNDAENLREFLPKILGQDYPVFEVIVVNDGSTDETKDVTTELEYRYSNLYQTYVPDEARNVSRKKLSLTVGIKAAKYDIVLLTNANCFPKSDKWIASMMRNFVPDIDIVAGYSYFERKKQAGSWYLCYDRLMFSLRYLSYLLCCKPYMGEGSNLAYRKELFFTNKGFSRHLNLHYGDDDLFINEIADATNTRAELSEESQMTVYYDNNFRAWRELKLRYDFTSRYLKSSYKAVFGFERLTTYLFYAAVVSLISYDAFNLVSLGVALFLFLIRYAVIATVYRKSARKLSSPPLFFLLLFFDLAQTVVNFYYRIVGNCSKSKNFTWKMRN